MQVLCERCAGIDIGKDVIAVAVRMPGGGRDRRKTVKRTYRAFYGVLREMARWLASEGVTHVAMEAAGVCSMPVCYALLEHGFGEVLACSAGHVKNVPGRKTDLADAEWLAQLPECGLLRGSFIPAADVKAVRDLVRYRPKIAQQRVSELARPGDVLQDAGIRPGPVASSIATKPGLRMIEALIDGERRGQVLADLAIGRMRSKAADLSMALEGRFAGHHAMLCRLHLDHIARLEAMIAELDARVEAAMQPFLTARDLLVTIPGIAVLSAAAVISEIGPAPQRYFPTAAHLASRAGVCPGSNESAGKRHSGKRRRGNVRLQPVLAEIAWSAVRQEGYLRALCHRHVIRNGGYRSAPAKNKAIITVAHAVLVIIWHVLTTGRPYRDLGAGYFDRRSDPARETQRLIARPESLGHHVTLGPGTPGEPGTAA